MQTTETEHLRTYYQSQGRALNASGLEAILKLPRRALRDWLKGEQWLPLHHVPPLLAWARRYGYKENASYDSK